MPHTFRKHERLNRKKVLEKMFAGGARSYSFFPLRMVYIFAPELEGAQVSVLVSVSKRHFKRAVKRNRVKRQIREAYRMNKELLPVTEEGCDMLIIYMGKDVRQSEDIGNGVRELLSKLAEPVRGMEGRSKENGGSSPDSLG